MAVVIAVNPDEPVATLTACHIVVTGAEDNRGPNKTGGPFEYQLRGTSDDWDGKPLLSHIFNTSEDWEHRWDGLIFPVAGTWTIDLVDRSDDSVEGTVDVEVS